MGSKVQSELRSAVREFLLSAGHDVFSLKGEFLLSGAQPSAGLIKNAKFAEPFLPWNLLSASLTGE